MAIDKKLILFKTRKAFDASYGKGDIANTSVVFIEDTGELWTHGKFYCKTNGSDHNHNDLYLKLSGGALSGNLTAPKYLSTASGKSIEMFAASTYGKIQTRGSIPLLINDEGNNVAIGKTTASEKLDVNGAVLASGFKRSGSSDSYVLLGGGSHHSLSDLQNSYEANLRWGGKNFNGSYGCIDAAMVPFLGANRLAFMPTNAITVEYSRDSGATWIDYGATASQIGNLFSGASSAGLVIGKADANNKDDGTFRLRITINTGVGRVYTSLNKFCIYVSTSGSTGVTCTIDAALEATPTVFNKMISNNTPVSGWSGYNILNVDPFTTYGNTPTSHYGRVRFTFASTGGSATYTGLQVQNIYGFGGVGWVTPSNMARWGQIYSYDSAQGATFPANLKATGILYEGSNRVYSAGNTNIGIGASNYAAGNRPITAISTTSTEATFTRAVGNLTLTYPTFNQNTTGDAAGLSTTNSDTIGPTGNIKSTRLRFIQKPSDAETMPDTGWWSLLRTQHGGYDNGYWQEMAYSFSKDEIKFRRNVSGAKQPWKTIAFTDSNITGNASTADKLKTKRKINNVDFDGSENIETTQMYRTSIIENDDLNTLIIGGWYACNGAALAKTLKNCPTATTFSMLVAPNSYSRLSQTIYDYDGNSWIRYFLGTGWTTWRKFLSSTNYTDYTVTKIGGGASGSWNINAATVTNGVYTNTDQTITGKKTFSVQQAFTVAQGTSPFTVTSNTTVANLSANYLQGLDSSGFWKKGELEIGDRNLIINSTKPTANPTAYLLDNYYFGTFTPVHGETYTIIIKSDLNGRTAFRPHNIGGNSPICGDITNNDKIGDVYVKTFNWNWYSLATNKTGISLYAAGSPYPEVNVEWIKLIRGNLTSLLWSPAPEDKADISALNLKADLASPTFTGTPLAPTAAAKTNTTQIATTAFVRKEVSDLVNGAPETLDTLAEIAAYLTDGNVAGSIVQQLAAKVSKAGDTLTGRLLFNNCDGIAITSDNKDLSLLKVFGSAEGTWGFDIKYMGTGSGNDNSLRFICDNQTGTKVNALDIKQNGDIIGGALFNSIGGLQVNGVNVSLTGHTHNELVGVNYTSGGNEKPKDFGAGKLRYQMLGKGTQGTNSIKGGIPSDNWTDAIWLSAYGNDVPNAHVLLFGKYSNSVGFRKQRHDAETWGAYYEFFHTGNSNLSTIDWSAKSLTLAGSITGATTIDTDTITSNLIKSGSRDIISPKGGIYTTTTNTCTGAIKITLPASIGNTMVSMWIDVYNYVSNTSFSVHCGGYTYNNSTWSNNPFAMVYGADHTVRLSCDGTNFFIHIGELNSTWSYPQIKVRDIIIGYTPTIAKWNDSLVIGFESNAFPLNNVLINHKAWTSKNFNPNNYSLTSHTHTDYASTITTTGSGNAITSLSINGNIITADKGNSFLPLSGGTLSASASTGGILRINNISTTLTEESSIGFRVNNEDFWTIGKGTGGIGNSFGWWYGVPGNVGNKMILTESGYLTTTGFIKSGSTNEYLLTGDGGHKAWTFVNTPSTIVERDGSGDIHCRLIRSNYQDENRLVGGIVFRVSINDNYHRVCNSPSAARTWMGAASTEHTHNYAGSSSVGGVATKSYVSEQIEAFTGDDFSGGNHYLKAIRYDGWHTRLYMGYHRDGTKQNTVHVGYADSAISSNYTGFVTPKYDGGVILNPQQYFNRDTGLRVAMTGATGSQGDHWGDTLWINGYAGTDVPNCCALHFSRHNARMFLSLQDAGGTSYGTLYEVYHKGNLDIEGFANRHGHVGYDFNTRELNVHGDGIHFLKYGNGAGGWDGADIYLDNEGNIDITKLIFKVGDDQYDSFSFRVANTNPLNIADTGITVNGDINVSQWIYGKDILLSGSLQAATGISSSTDVRAGSKCRIVSNYDNEGWLQMGDGDYKHGVISAMYGANIDDLEIKANKIICNATSFANNGYTKLNHLRILENPHLDVNGFGIDLGIDSGNSSPIVGFNDSRTSADGYSIRIRGVEAMAIKKHACFSNAWNTYSDIRLKNNIVDLENSLDKLMKISAKRFNYNDGLQNQMGVIAQELNILYPELVNQNNGYLSVNYIGLIPVLTKALQELTEKVKKLESKLYGTN